jgi:malonate-semialdehyde dehydrogenase (acetylating)/methylmalonate-semialdehyde dehydrogenase
MATTLHHYIGGKKVPGKSGRFGDVYNPTTGEKSADAPFASKEEVEAAIADSQKAFAQWSAMSPMARARVMFKFKELVEKHMDELALLVSNEHGKVLSDARGSVQRGLEVVEFACGIPHLMKGEYSDSVSTGIDVYSMRQPLGVVAGITPFNFPAMVPMWMFAVAIAAGNTFVLKPSEKDPSCPLRLGELMVEAGAPPGVLNVVIGDKVAVDTLLSDPRVQAISFVGSTPIAHYVYETAARNGKRVQAMGGAKNHMIVMPDADMDQAVDALVGAGYGSAGERCMAVSVAVPVGEKTADALIGKLAPRVRALKVGPSTAKDSEMGPLVTRQHYEKVRGYIDHGVEEGAKLVVDGRDLRLQGYEKGYFMGGSLFDRVTPAMKIYKEEIFGPVLSVVRAKNYEEAARLPTEHEFGNGVAIFTRDGDAAREFAAKVQVGMVGVNVPIPVPLAFHTFGGWKRSAFGDANQHGPEGVRFYTKIKTVTARWPTGIRAGAEFNIPTLK